MKKKCFIRSVAAILLLVVLAAVAMLCFLPVSFGGSGVTRPDALPGDMLLTAEQVQADRQQLIGYVESVHPFFVDGTTFPWR